MKINNIKIENFLSIKEAAIDFEDYSNLVHIVGHNHDSKPKGSNGAGKSAVIEAIVFALFGKTLRKTSEKNLTRYDSKGKCKVTITVNDDVIIERTKKPPRLIVTAGGENVTKESIQKTQQHLESFLNTNRNVFLASMVFGQQNSTNFLTASPEEKREIIQSFLSVKDIFKHRGAIKGLKSNSFSEKKIATTLQDECLGSIKKLETEISELNKLKKAAKKYLSPEKVSFVTKYSMSEIKEMEDKRHELDKECSYQEMRLTNLLSEKEKLKAKVKEPSSSCDNCGFVDPEDKVKKILLGDKIHELSEKIAEKRKEIKDLSAKIDETTVPITSADFDTVEKLINVESSLKVLRAQKRKAKKLSKQHADKVAVHQKQYDIMRFWEYAFSENGLIKYVIRNILEFFNERANHYLGVVSSGNISVEFDDSLKDTFYSNGNEIYFDSMSGGEKKRCSLAVTMALNDLLVVTGKERPNLIFFDEIADSLDFEGVKGLYELINLITQDKKLFIITHNDYLNSLIEDEADTFKVIKRNGITKILHN